MEKSANKEKEISYVLDTRTITKTGTDLILKASQKQCDELAKYYELPAVKKLEVKMHVALNKDYIEINGNLKASVTEQCVISLEEFDENINHPFKLLFSEDADFVASMDSKIDFSIDDEPVELVKNSKIYFFDIIQEQLGLAINPFPKKTDKPFTYYEQKSEDAKTNPFDILKHLTK